MAGVPDGTYGLVDLSKHVFVWRGLNYPRAFYVHVSGTNFVIDEGGPSFVVVSRDPAAGFGFCCTCGKSQPCDHVEGMMALERRWSNE